MYKFILKGITNKYEYDELIKIFINPDQYTVQCRASENFITNDEDCVQEDAKILEFGHYGREDKNQLKQEIYSCLSRLTGYRPEWGILTGVRPVKLTGDIYRQLLDYHKVREHLTEFYFVSDEKADLLVDMHKYQQSILPVQNSKAVGLYIGIPFCPTRCIYCSFASNQVDYAEIKLYLEALFTEIDYVSKQMNEKGYYAETIYVGGGTPTTLNNDDLGALLDKITNSFDLSRVIEFTVEAGRPDTINEEKLKTIKKSGVERISINPQSMKEETLKLIGRSHSSKDIETAFKEARAVGIPIINADVIAGLPEENVEDFVKTLSYLVKQNIENITVHTLAVKKASRLIDIEKDYHYKQGEIVKQQLAESRKILKEAGYIPYYMYRQKHMAGNFENIGYCKSGTAGIYNIRIMEEKQTIVAMGAGAISKQYYPEEDRLERVPNVTNYQIYIERIQEMLDRKEKDLLCR